MTLLRSNPSVPKEEILCTDPQCLGECGRGKISLVVQRLCKHGEITRMCTMCRREKEYYEK